MLAEQLVDADRGRDRRVLPDAADRDGPSDHGRIGAEVLAPDVVCEDDAVERRLVGEVRPAPLSRNAKDGQIVRRRDLAPEPGGRASHLEGHRRQAIRRHAGEDVATVADVFIGRPRREALPRVDACQAGRFDDRRWRQEQRIDDREDGGIATDRHGECGDRHSRKSAIAHQQAHAECDITP